MVLCDFGNKPQSSDRGCRNSFVGVAICPHLVTAKTARDRSLTLPVYALENGLFPTEPVKLSAGWMVVGDVRALEVAGSIRASRLARWFRCCPKVNRRRYGKIPSNPKRGTLKSAAVSGTGRRWQAVIVRDPHTVGDAPNHRDTFD